MEFRTEISIPKAPFTLSHRDEILFAGSCFSENIGAYFTRFRFNTTINSHGILFNPISIAHALKEVCENKRYTLEDLIFHNNSYISLNHHGLFNHSDSQQALTQITQGITAYRDALERSKALFITFGSAHAYMYNTNGQIVANCHKIPQHQFTKQLITHTQITDVWMPLIEKMKRINPGMNVVLTVSPVRYFRDGVIENQHSKSHLLIACHQLTQAFEHVYYFPSYELVLDDLRDYRFFGEDLIHPNTLAIRYVWEKLMHWCLHHKAIQVIHEMEPHLRFLEHRPLHANSDDHRAACKQKESILQQLINYVPTNPL